MYNVHMVRFSATEARKELFRLLDSVEEGEEVVVERKGVRFRLVLDRSGRGQQKPPKRLEVTDPDILAGQWTWAAGRDGQLQFQPRSRKK